ncbi:hypothetical protein FJZ53_04765 [Candidatus Woesearchaeota archaeon]|nr:hypothetical protein [Candidatus Woesearchaeota archaeon]
MYEKTSKNPDCNPYGIKISCKPRVGIMPVDCKIGPVGGPIGPRKFDAYPTIGRPKSYPKKDDKKLTRDYTSNPYPGGTLIPDICKNYEPIKSKPRDIEYADRKVYECNNFESHEGMEYGGLFCCSLFCCNWVNRDGEDHGYKSAPEKMVKYYVNLYKTDSEKFIRFFQKRRNQDDKKKILEGILSCDFSNEEVIKYLDSHWSDLVREVGLNII